MSKRADAVKKWRFNTKKRIIKSLGGNCVCCGYYRCQRSMVCHHLEDDDKDFSLGAVRAFPMAWKKIVAELRKCVLVCANCHGEIHDNITEVPSDARRFDEEYANYKKIESCEKQNKCPICGKKKSIRKITCSRSCAAKRQYKIDWDSIDLLEMIKHKSIVQIAYDLDVSDMAVRKRLKKINA